MTKTIKAGSNQQVLLFCVANKDFQLAFWSNVNVLGPDDCWEWKGEKRDRDGYARISGKGSARFTRIATSRIAMALHVQRALESAERVCHTCDNPPCNNPAHLFIGTQGDNIRDARSKGRGKSNTGVVMTLDKANKIRRMYKETNLTQKEIAAIFGLTGQQVSNIILNYNWTVERVTW